MTVKSKTLEKLNIVENKENAYKKRITKEYNQVLKEMTKELSMFTAKMKNGKLSPQEMNKFNRTEKLVKSLTSELKKIQATKPQILDAYLKDQYNFNFSYTGFINEGEYQTKLNYVQPSKKKVDNAIKNPLNKISLENNRSQVVEKVRSAITQSILRGEGINAASARLKKALEQNANNAFRIVRTETTKIMGKADQDSINHAVSNGLDLEKEWLTTQDGRQRDSHGALDGQVVDADKPFVIPSGENDSGATAMHPGDFGIAEQDINCRCTIITRLKDFKSSAEFRRVRGVNGQNEIIESKNFDVWKKERYN